MFFYGVNYSTGNRGQELQGFITGTGGNADGKGIGNTASAQLFSQTITHTLTYTKEFNDISLTALGGYEYYSTKYKSQSASVYQFDYNLSLANAIPVHYYDNMQDGKQANLTTSSSNDPTTELQSYFGRIQLGYGEVNILLQLLSVQMVQPNLVKIIVMASSLPFQENGISVTRIS